MGNISGTLQHSQQQIRTIQSGQVASQAPLDKVQHLDSAEGCLPRRLESGQQLSLPTNKPNSSNNTENYQEPREGFLDYPELEKLLVISCRTLNLRKDRTVSEKDAQSIAINRTIKELKMDRISSNSSEWQPLLQKLRICLS